MQLVAIYAGEPHLIPIQPDTPLREEMAAIQADLDPEAMQNQNAMLGKLPERE